MTFELNSFVIAHFKGSYGQRFDEFQLNKETKGRLYVFTTSSKTKAGKV